MAITKLAASVSVHQTLPNEPNDEGGMTAAELKAAWDAPANIIKEYVNASLIPELDAEHLPYIHGLSGGQTVKEALEEVVAGVVPDGSVTVAKLTVGLQKLILPWALLQSYTAAGTYTYTVPDLYNGEAYELGVYLIGGGGSGSAWRRSSTWTNLGTRGGCAGFGRNIVETVNPGSTKAIVVGSGGAAVSVSSEAGAAGNGGNTSSFDGYTAAGGSGGEYLGSAFVYGGQAPDGDSKYDAITRNSPYGGMLPISDAGLCQSPVESQNRFDPTMVTLSAGGYGRKAGTSGSYTYYGQPGSTVTGGKGGGGAAAASAATAESATGYGNGGGGAYAAGSTVTSGAGSSGAVFIYARRLAT